VTVPKWLEQLEEARLGGAVGCVLTFNTGDRVYCPEVCQTPLSLPYFLAKFFSGQGYRVGLYAQSRGFEDITPPEAGVPANSSPARISADSSQPMALRQLHRIVREPKTKTVLILDYADHVAPESHGRFNTLSADQTTAVEILHGWGHDDAIRQTDNFVVMIAYTGNVNSLITQGGGYRVVSVDLPREDERRAFAEFIQQAKEKRPGLFGSLIEDFSWDEYVCVTGGLRLSDIEEMFRRSAGQQTPIDREMVRDQKKRSISALCKDLLEIIEPVKGFEALAGAEHAKRYFRNIIPLWRAGHRSIPQAVLLSGVPGCGKSFLVQALAKELGCPCLVMRNIREGLVGESERNLERVLRVAESLAPCLLWTDEVDQAIGQRGTGQSGDSGTSERIIARIFEFFGSMQHRGRVLWVATTNRPDLLDPALLDRFQVVIPFIHPNRSERSSLISVLSEQIDRVLANPDEAAELAADEALDFLTVRALQEIVVYAGVTTDTKRGAVGEPVEIDALVDAVREYKPNFNPVEHEFLALKALEMTSFNSLLPWRALDGNERTIEVPKYLSGIIRDDLTLDHQALSQRIQELARSLYAQKSMR